MRGREKTRALSKTSAFFAYHQCHHKWVMFKWVPWVMFLFKWVIFFSSLEDYSTHPIPICSPIFEPGHLHHKWTGKSHVTTICRSAHTKQNPRRRRYTLPKKSPKGICKSWYTSRGDLMKNLWQPQENMGFSKHNWCLTSEVTWLFGYERLGFYAWKNGLLEGCHLDWQKHLTPRHLEHNTWTNILASHWPNILTFSETSEKVDSLSAATMKTSYRDAKLGVLPKARLWWLMTVFGSKSGLFIFPSIKLWEGEPDQNLEMDEISGNWRNPLDCIPPNFSRLWLKAPLLTPKSTWRLWNHHPKKWTELRVFNASFSSQMVINNYTYPKTANSLPLKRESGGMVFPFIWGGLASLSFMDIYLPFWKFRSSSLSKLNVFRQQFFFLTSIIGHYSIGLSGPWKNQPRNHGPPTSETLNVRVFLTGPSPLRHRRHAILRRW